MIWNEQYKVEIDKMLEIDWAKEINKEKEEGEDAVLFWLMVAYLGQEAEEIK